MVLSTITRLGMILFLLFQSLFSQAKSYGIIIHGQDFNFKKGAINWEMFLKKEIKAESVFKNNGSSRSIIKSDLNFFSRQLSEYDTLYFVLLGHGLVAGDKPIGQFLLSSTNDRIHRIMISNDEEILNTNDLFHLIYQFSKLNLMIIIIIDCCEPFSILPLNIAHMLNAVVIYTNDGINLANTDNGLSYWSELFQYYYRHNGDLFKSIDLACMTLACKYYYHKRIRINGHYENLMKYYPIKPYVIK